MARTGSSDGVEPFLALSEVARSLRAVRRDVTHLRRVTGVAARDACAIAGWVRSLPTLSLEPSRSAAGDEMIRGLCSHQPRPFRYRAVAVITLERDFESYLRGRSKQAVRTNRRHAATLGVTVSPVTSKAAALALLETMFERHAFAPTVDDLLRHHVASGRSQIWFACTSAGVPVAMAAVAVDRGVAQLATLQVALDAADRSATRYLLSTEVIRSLIDQQVSHLIADSMLFSSPGVVYLQRRLGFEPTNIAVPRRRRRSTGDHDAAELGPAADQRSVIVAVS